MAKLDHGRPILKLIDELRRQRRTPTFLAAHPKRTGASEPPLPYSKGTLSALAASEEAFSTSLHNLACSVLAHVEKTGQTRLVDKLIAAMPASVRVNALMTWFVMFGPIDFVGGRAHFRKGAPTHLDVAIAAPFWMLEPED